jgi:poly(hydroxyalkanoate) depolymerase family esterase
MSHFSSLAGPSRALAAGCLLWWASGCGPDGLTGGLLEEEEENVGQVESALTQVTGFGSNPGNLLMYTHVPSGLPSPAPLVLVLHGCTQTAAAMEASGWTAAANAQKFYLVYAQQQSSNNGSSCFNWFELGDTTRGQGEALSLKQMVDWVKANASIDSARVFVTGFSAGAYMAAVMAATYPDVFAGAAVQAGGPYRCATSSSEAFTCMNPGVTRTPQQWGDLVRNAFPGYTGPRPRIALWHGTSDFTVRPANLTESVKQWTNVFGTDQTADVTETVLGQAHRVYRDGSGNPVVETFEVSGMGHAIAIDPQFSFPSGGACGSTGSYMTDANICATYYQEVFFGLASGGGGGGGGGGTVSFSSIASEDGYVKAFADGSSAAVGTLASLAVGRGTDSKLNRTILSFDTASLPDGATITAATVTVTYSSSSGNPWNDPAGNSMVVDVRNGTFGAAGTETGDWAAAATASAVATVEAFTSGTKQSSPFSAAGLSAVNRTGRTQLRLRFSQNQAATNYIFLREGASATLTITYQ